jgi:hypothetical protein
MKYFYLIGSVLFTVVILILGFGNIQAQCNFVTFFFSSVPPSIPVPLLIFGLSGLGVITGFFYFGFIHALMQEGSDQEQDSDW